MLIGYYVSKMTMLNSKGQRLGEGDCLKIIVNHYPDNYQKVDEVSKSRGANFKVLMTSYNISYNKDNDNDKDSYLPSLNVTVKKPLVSRGLHLHTMRLIKGVAQVM